MTLFRNGFVIEPENTLRSYEANQVLFQQILNGQAPMDILQVPFESEVDLRVIKKLNEDFSNDKLPYSNNIFIGTGQSLGKSSAPLALPRESTHSNDSDVKVSVKLANGERISSSFHSNSTLANVYSFVAS